MTYQQAQEKGWQVKKGERVWSILHLTITTMRHSRDGRGTKMQMKLALSDAELLALEAQINPHFLFNCLNSIRGMIVEDAVQPLDTGQVLITRREFDLAPKIHAGANSRGNAGPMESMEGRTLKAVWPPTLPTVLGNRQSSDFAHSYRTATTANIDISIRRALRHFPRQQFL